MKRNIFTIFDPACCHQSSPRRDLIEEKTEKTENCIRIFQRKNISWFLTMFCFFIPKFFQSFCCIFLSSFINKKSYLHLFKILKGFRLGEKQKVISTLNLTKEKNKLKTFGLPVRTVFHKTFDLLT
jgi:hypothetical protein